MFFQIYSNICKQGMSREQNYGHISGLHKHHIIPKHSGGDDSENNITYLTVREHIIAHYLLWKINKNPNDLRSMKILGAKLTSSQRKITGEYCRDNSIGMFRKDSFDLSERSKKSAATCKELGIGIFNKDKKKEWTSNGGKKSFKVNKEFRFWASPEGRKLRASLGGQANKGKKTMYKPGDKSFIRVKEKDFEHYIKLGYIFGSPHKPVRTDKVFLSISKKVSIDGVIFESMKSASEEYKISYHTVRNRIKSSKFPTWVFYNES